jgi:hypothetical protein
MNKCRRKSVGYLSGCSPRILAWRGISSYCYGRTILVYLFAMLDFSKPSTKHEWKMEQPLGLSSYFHQLAIPAVAKRIRLVLLSDPIAPGSPRFAWTLYGGELKTHTSSQQTVFLTRSISIENSLRYNSKLIGFIRSNAVLSASDSV